MFCSIGNDLSDAILRFMLSPWKGSARSARGYHPFINASRAIIHFYGNIYLFKYLPNQFIITRVHYFV